MQTQYLPETDTETFLVSTVWRLVAGGVVGAATCAHQHSHSLTKQIGSVQNVGAGSAFVSMRASVPLLSSIVWRCWLAATATRHNCG